MVSEQMRSRIVTSGAAYGGQEDRRPGQGQEGQGGNQGGGSEEERTGGNKFA